MSSNLPNSAEVADVVCLDRPLSTHEWKPWGNQDGEILSRTDIMLASNSGDMLKLQALMRDSTEAAVNLQSPNDGASALHTAAACSKRSNVENAIQLLLEHGANPELKDNGGRRASNLLASVALKGMWSSTGEREGGVAGANTLPKGGRGVGEGPSVEDMMMFRTHAFRMFQFKVDDCPYMESLHDHDWTECPFAHPGEKARRRNPRKYGYTSTACPDFRKGACKRGDVCPYAHGVFECWLHPSKYCTQLCKDAGSCSRCVCFFAHNLDELRTPETPTEAPDLPHSSHSFLASGGAFSNSYYAASEERGQSFSPPPMLPIVSGPPSRDASMHGSSGNGQSFIHGSAPSQYVNAQAAARGILQDRCVSSSPLASLMDQLQLRKALPQQHPPLPRPPQRQQLSGMASNAGHQRIDMRAPPPPMQSDCAGFYTPPVSPASTRMTHQYSPVYSPYPPAPAQGVFDLTHPLLAGALQAGVLPQVLAQLSPSQLAMLSQQQEHQFSLIGQLQQQQQQLHPRHLSHLGRQPPDLDHRSSFNWGQNPLCTASHSLSVPSEHTMIQDQTAGNLFPKHVTCTDFRLGGLGSTSGTSTLWGPDSLASRDLQGCTHRLGERPPVWGPLSS